MKAKIDFKKQLKHLYQPPHGKFVEVEVPELRFVMVDGAGNPNSSSSYGRAVEWLYSTSYAMKFASKRDFMKDYVVPPLEGLWWADNPQDFIRRNKDVWQWTMMIMIPDFIPASLFSDAVEKASQKLGDPPETLRAAAMQEGRSLQTMHVGSYDDEGPVLAHLHDNIMPSFSLTFNGLHHEIYIGDPRKTAPERLKTVLRQPVKSKAN